MCSAVMVCACDLSIFFPVPIQKVYEKEMNIILLFCKKEQTKNRHTQTEMSSQTHLKWKETPNVPRSGKPEEKKKLMTKKK